MPATCPQTSGWVYLLAVIGVFAILSLIAKGSSK